MSYRNAMHVLPDTLLKEVQKYAAGEAIYIPQIDEKKKWGEGSGARSFYEKRNAQIREEFQKGRKAEDLAAVYALSLDRVKRIVYSQGGRESDKK